MEFKDREFIPVLLGGDINTYSVARAFYEQYQVKTYIFGKFATGPSYGSKIIEYHPNPKIDTDDYFLQTVNGFAKKHKDKKIMLIGCGDSYVALISKKKAELEKNIIAPYIDFDLMNSLQQKETFYKLCEKHGVDYPGTIIYDQSMGLDFEMNFPYPVILKPSDSISYWEHPFATQNKIYTIKDRKELEKVIRDIYGAGYTVIITEPNEELMMKVKNLLEDLHYVGFSNFDIKYDRRDGKYRFFEINTRQGRSNYYVTGSGFNVAKYVVEEYVYGKELPLEFAKEEHLWMTVPKAVAFKYIKEEANREKMRRLLKEKKMVNPVFKRGDFKPRRYLAMVKNHLRQFGNFKKYYS